MKIKLTLLSLCVACCSHPASSPLAFADSASSPPVILLQDGAKQESVNINFFDKSRLETEYLTILRERDSRAHDSLYASLESFHGGLRDLDFSTRELLALSTTSLTGPVLVEEFFSTVRKYEHTANLVKDQIETLSLIPSLKIEVREELSAKIDFNPLKQHYYQQLERLEQQVANTQFYLTLPSDEIHLQVGTDTRQLKSMKLFSAEQINNMRKQALTKKIMKTEERNVIDQGINAFTRSALETFIDTFGTSERYRTSSDQEGRKKAAEALADAFWARFYIRAVYGIKIGSIPLQYQKRIFNLDYLISNIKIGAVTLWSDDHLTTALNAATEAQATYRYQGQDYSLRRLTTWIAGAGAAEDAKKFIVDLLKTDLEQELALGSSGGLRKVRAAYRQHFYLNDTDKLHYQQKAAAVFGSEEDDDLEADLSVIEPGTLRGAIALCLNVLKSMELRLEEARRQEDSLALLTESDRTVNKRKKRSEL